MTEDEGAWREEADELGLQGPVRPQLRRRVRVGEPLLR